MSDRGKTDELEEECVNFFFFFSDHLMFAWLGIRNYLLVLLFLLSVRQTLSLLK